MKSQYFHRLADALDGLATDPATAGDPIKRRFLCDGEHLSCNVNILEKNEDVIHLQPEAVKKPGRRSSMARTRAGCRTI
jgi:hypothetical protein